ncbi:MAG: glycosyltransferase family 2 protein [Parcubacteria group bacterium]|nr:glycosyltransferase family 2 protein [Parcubacteria group bacterium]
MLSIVFPAYNEEKNVEELHRRIVSALKKTGEEFEIIAVDNASTDSTYQKLKTLSPIKIIRIGYNIGQTAALDAGIRAARDGLVVTIDADLQNDPNDIPAMLAKINEGYDAVVGWRVERNDSLGRKIFSASANWLTRTVLGFRLHDYACALKMFKKEFLGSTRLYGEMHVFLAAILYYHGAKIAEMPVRHHARLQGFSNHNFIKGVKNIADLFTMKFLMGTSRPLVVFGTLALLFWALGAAAFVWSISLKVMELRDFTGTPLPIVVAFFGVTGFVLLMMGFLAEIMLRIYYENKGGTPYVVRTVIENK